MEACSRVGIEGSDSEDVIEVVLGGGGIKGFGHIGFLKALARLRVKHGKFTGVSIGSLIAAFYTNGYQPDQIAEILLKELFTVSPARILRSMLVPSWLGFLCGDAGEGLVSIKSIIDDIVEKYQLTPNQNLRIIAYNLLGREPVVFEGVNYDLKVALAASCAVPLVMRPVWYGQTGFVKRWLTLLGSALKETDEGILIDGGIHHPAPGDFSKSRAIIAKLGFASQLPSSLCGPADMWFHMIELAGSQILNWYFEDPKDHIVVSIGAPDIACLSFGVPEQDLRRMVNRGYRSTVTSLRPAIRAGLVPTI